MSPMKPTPLTCPWALHNLVVNHDGTYLPCCRTQSQKGFPLQKDLDIEAAFQHPMLQSIRSELAQGQFPVSCNNCKKEEEIGLKSLRQKTYPHNHLKTAELLNLELFLGNTCNMKCRMCGPDSSSLWAKELKIKQKQSRAPLSFIESADLSSVKQLKLLGGETLISPHLERVLDHFIDQDWAQNISLLISTNGSVAPHESLIKRLEKFQSLQLDFSIDGIGPVAEYIRHGQPWQLIHGNLLAWKKYHKTHFRFRNHCTIQATNIHQIIDLILLSYELEFEFSYRLLDYPQALRVDNLPLPVRQKILQFCKEHRESGKVQDYLKISGAKQLWTFLTEGLVDLKYSHLSHLIYEMQKYDLKWGVDWKVCLPDLYHDLIETKFLSDHECCATPDAK